MSFKEVISPKVPSGWPSSPDVTKQTMPMASKFQTMLWSHEKSFVILSWKGASPS